MRRVRAKYKGIALPDLTQMRQRGELTQEPLSPPPSLAVNEGRAFRVAAAPRTDQTQRIERQRFVAAKRRKLSLVRGSTDLGT